MAVPTSNQFKNKADGKLYTFVVSFVGNDINGKPFDPITFDNAQIEYFKYENQLNQLYLNAELVCNDSLGRIDRILDKMYVQCQVVFSKMEEKFDGKFTLPSFSKKVLFRHNFLIENVSILNRNNQNIKYKIQLSSINVLKCNANISYTNYNLIEKDRTLLNILKSCILLADLKIDQKSFENIDTTITTTFITNGNDTIQSISKFILNKMFYTSKDNSLKFIRYNETSDTYMMYDIKDKKQALGITNVVLSMMNSNKESMTSSIQANLGTVTKFPQNKTIQSFFKHDFKDYDYNNNIFYDRSLQSNELVSLINKAPEIKNTQPKFVWTLDKSTLDFSIRGGIWNNSFSVYENMIRILTKNNALVINCQGDILRKPGDYVVVSIDRDEKQITSEKRADLNDVMTRYSGLEGAWSVFRSVHIIEPSKEVYTQNLVLMRNFSLKTEEKI